MRLRNRLIQSCLLFFGLILTQCVDGQSLTLSTPPTVSKPIAEMLADTLSTSEIPGVIAAIAKADQPLQIGCAGLRHFKKPVLVSPEDQVHLGSCTKSMTATLIGRLIDHGKLDWDSTIADCLPELAGQIHPDYHEVTLQQLLMHRSGMPAQALNWWNSEGEDVTAKRRSIAIESLAAKPETPPGSEFLYSNLGYMIAGLMASSRGDLTWEELMIKEIFQPLKMKSAGFGAPGEGLGLEQPWGHRKLGRGMIATQTDNAPALGPAGTVHCSVSDWARFAMVHANPQHPLITSATRSRLQQISPELRSAGQKYAMGWGVSSQPWSQGQVLGHSGSNTMWYSTIFVAPEEQVAYLVAANIANPETSRELNRVIEQLIEIQRGQRSE